VADGVQHALKGLARALGRTAEQSSYAAHGSPPDESLINPGRLAAALNPFLVDHDLLAEGGVPLDDRVMWVVTRSVGGLGGGHMAVMTMMAPRCLHHGRMLVVVAVGVSRTFHRGGGSPVMVVAPFGAGGVD
jgi:hypothetical protein